MLFPSLWWSCNYWQSHTFKSTTASPSHSLFFLLSIWSWKQTFTVHESRIIMAHNCQWPCPPFIFLLFLKSHQTYWSSPLRAMKLQDRLWDFFFFKGCLLLLPLTPTTKCETDKVMENRRPVGGWNWRPRPVSKIFQSSIDKELLFYCHSQNIV